MQQEPDIPGFVKFQAQHTEDRVAFLEQCLIDAGERIAALETRADLCDRHWEAFWPRYNEYFRFEDEARLAHAFFLLLRGKEPESEPFPGDVPARRSQRNRLVGGVSVEVDVQ